VSELDERPEYCDGAPCRDCGVLTLPPAGGPAEYYMVRDDLWAEAGMGRWDGYLCVGCLEVRLGRTLCAADFHDSWVEAPGVNALDPPARFAWSHRTGRLADRLRREIEAANDP
jgi:hypothetical protein